MLVLCLAIALAGMQEMEAAQGTVRIWTDVDGRQVIATFISADAEYVYLDVNGTQHQVPLARLSRSCREWVAEAVRRPAPAPAPEEKQVSATDPTVQYLQLPPPAAIREMVRTVAYELSSHHPGEFRRIARNSTLSIHGQPSDAHRDIVDQSLATVDEVLRHTQIRIRRIGNNRDADIMIFIGPQPRFLHFAKRYGFSYRAEVPVFYALRSESGNITAGLICIDPEKTDSLYFHRSVLNGILHCLGLRGNTNLVKESIFNPEYFGEFDPNRLLLLDKAVAIFCLRNLQPGADMSLFERTFNGRWPEVVRTVLKELDPPEQSTPPE